MNLEVTQHELAKHRAEEANESSHAVVPLSFFIGPWQVKCSSGR